MTTSERAVNRARMKIVIAGNYAQYRQWLIDNNLTEHDARYVDSNEKLMGLELAHDDIIYTGTYWDSPVDRTLITTRIRK